MGTAAGRRWQWDAARGGKHGVLTWNQDGGEGTFVYKPMGVVADLTLSTRGAIACVIASLVPRAILQENYWEMIAFEWV